MQGVFDLDLFVDCPNRKAGEWGTRKMCGKEKYEYE
jgi:hypothetical protein